MDKRHNKQICINIICKINKYKEDTKRTGIKAYARHYTFICREISTVLLLR